MFIKIIAYFVAGILLLTHLPQARASPAVSANMTRIVGGSATTIQNVPYLVQVWQNSKFICGGALVSSRFVVSAAHCVVGAKTGQLTIVGGASKLTDTGVRRSVSKIIRPKKFSTENMNRDVAVFKLASPMTGTNIRAIGLNTQKLTTSMALTVSGWGKTDENASDPSPQVRTVIVPIITKAKCTKQYRQIIALSGTMFCAAKAGSKDACTGDSGGPAVCNGKLCGIVSWGKGCARADYSGIYTSVRSVLGTIRNAMKQ